MLIHAVGWKFGRYAIQSSSTVVYASTVEAQGSYSGSSVSTVKYYGHPLPPKPVEPTIPAPTAPRTALEINACHAAHAAEMARLGVKRYVAPRPKRKVWVFEYFDGCGRRNVKHLSYCPSGMREQDAVFL